MGITLPLVEGVQVTLLCETTPSSAAKILAACLVSLTGSNWHFQYFDLPPRQYTKGRDEKKHYVLDKVSGTCTYIFAMIYMIYDKHENKPANFSLWLSETSNGAKIDMRVQADK